MRGNQAERGLSAFLENLGFGELLVILVVALVVFGPNKLPELGKSLGQGIREFKKATSSIKEEVAKAAMEETKEAAKEITQASQADTSKSG